MIPSVRALADAGRRIGEALRVRQPVGTWTDVPEFAVAVQRTRNLGLSADEVAARLVLYPRSKTIDVSPRRSGR